MSDAARLLYADVLGDANMTALLLDASGSHAAGSYVDADGREAGPEIAAALAGIGADVERAMRHLDIGEWRALVVETTDATIAVSPGASDSVVLVAASSEEPPGLVRRVLARAVARSDEWLLGGGE